MLEFNPYGSQTDRNYEVTNKNVGMLVESMREMMMGQMYEDMVETTQHNRAQRNLEREKERAKITSGSITGAVNPVQEFMKGFGNAEWLKTWTEMEPEQQKGIWDMVNQYGMMNQTQANMMNPMMFQYMLMQQQKGGSSDIKIQDLITMFTTGMSQAMELAKGNQPAQQTSITEMIDAVSKITAPMSQKADAATAKNYELLLEQVKAQKTGGVAETISVIKEISETFGGGGTSSADIEIARLQSTNAFQMAQLQADMQIRAEEMRAESSKWDQIGGLAMTGLGAVGGVVAQNMRQMGQQAAHTGVRANPNQTMPPMQSNLPGAPATGYAQVECGECGAKFQVPLTPSGGPPKRVECPSCHEKLEG